MSLDSNRFGICNAKQRVAALDMARKLRDGGALELSPCDLWPYLRGRTLWLLGDSHTKSLYKSLQCFMLDFWEGKECAASPEAVLMQQLDALPTAHGESRFGLWDLKAGIAVGSAALKRALVKLGFDYLE
ncbi:hypothetical protein MNEG_6895 [Monoraphidium neglectum]|uniref:Uncharacterized protein n=1 Tax=Monoraphidium neglectum TaxID=145388 RepID=A0A0D2JPL7_9CHLO|nr:hypothetical protein MNEG_6895 [Monoraphidium neglectum]KIZ01068.1 hypothetical protein MNEG_6895 [Monoraphidium neglectum]|eukprot:XP_013900087.1 hypothetical protein MNEG_6895 [Monoraphidium neglectum]